MFVINVALLSILAGVGLSQSGGPIIPVPCTFANNTLGQCECPGQFFVADDCHKGFYCLDQNQVPGHEGCEIACNDNQVLVVDPRNSGSWSCRNVDENSQVLEGICPGKFNTECGCSDHSNPACEVGTCECEGQLWVNHDCKKAKYCESTDEDDSTEITCQDDQIVYVNMIDHSWACGIDDGRCPGSFHVGCQKEEKDPIIPLPCTFANNTLGQCECPGQFFVAEDCHKGFYCLNQNQVPGHEGCEIACQDNQVLVVDPRNSGSWSCKNVDENSQVLGGICPGKFNTECGCSDHSNPACEVGTCECEGQLWVNHDCKKAKYCDSTDAGDSTEITCQDDQIVYVNMIDFSWACGIDDGRCPGSFHVGCQKDDYPPNGASSLISSLVLLLTSAFAFYL